MSVSTAMQSVKHKVQWRLDFMREAVRLPFRDRLSHIIPQANRSRQALIDRLVRKAADGEPYFELRDWRIFFLPPEAGEHADTHYRSARTVMIESFLDTEEFYSRDVDISPGDTVLDVGAYIGTCALNFAHKAGPGGQVFAFEPVMGEVVRRNLRENAISNVELIPKAVSDQCGDIDMMIGEQIIDSSCVRKPGKISQTRSVPMTSLDAFAEKRQLASVDYIKLDIEGAEELAIRGAAKIIERFRPAWSISSYHTDHEGHAQHPKLCRLLQEQHGYQIEERHEGEKPVRILAW